LLQRTQLLIVAGLVSKKKINEQKNQTQVNINIYYFARKNA